MPTVLRVRGFRFFFFSGEGNEPPHIHVESAEDHAKFWLRPVALAGSVGYNAKKLRQIRDMILEYRDLFEERWNEHFGRGEA
jgi:hypothetical protein